jgi:hypothetical protein
MRDVTKRHAFNEDMEGGGPKSARSLTLSASGRGVASTEERHMRAAIVVLSVVLFVG